MVNVRIDKKRLGKNDLYWQEIEMNECFFIHENLKNKAWVLKVWVILLEHNSAVTLVEVVKLTSAMEQS